MVVLSLFAGVGGIDLAVEHLLGVQTSLMVERDPFCQRILRRHFPGVPIRDDVREVGDLGADIVCGGPPCQAASLAGKQLGEADERWMWPDAIRIVRENRPRLAMFENVSGLLHLDGGRAWAKIVGDLDAAGYATRWDHAEAARAGAPHRRDRIWIVCVPHARWTAPTTAEPVPGSLFGTAAETPAWTRAGWYARGRWGSETARWPRVGAALSAWPTATVGDEKNARNRTSGRTNPNSTHADGETLCDAVEIEAGKWPTPRSGSERASRGSMVDAAQWSAPALEQAAELATGILPREFHDEAELNRTAASNWPQSSPSALARPTPRGEDAEQAGAHGTASTRSPARLGCGPPHKRTTSAGHRERRRSHLAGTRQAFRCRRRTSGQPPTRWSRTSPRTLRAGQRVGRPPRNGSATATASESRWRWPCDLATNAWRPVR